MPENTCEHLNATLDRTVGVHPSGHGCQECLETGGRWVHLRLCLECGHVGCCDDSPGRHATGHFHTTRHPVIRSYEPREDWLYCYEDGTLLAGVRPLGDEAAPVHHQSI